MDALTVTWPVSRTSQTFRRIPADRTIEIAEDAGTYRVVERPRSPAATRAGR